MERKFAIKNVGVRRREMMRIGDQQSAEVADLVSQMAREQQILATKVGSPGVSENQIMSVFTESPVTYGWKPLAGLKLRDIDHAGDIYTLSIGTDANGTAGQVQLTKDA
jgi:hypothetical protein